MKRNILCIVIALMVLSLSALLIAGPVLYIFAEITSTLNGEPITVTLAKDVYKPFQTLDIQELRDNWADHDGKFVRFTATVASIWTVSPATVLANFPPIDVKNVERLILARDPRVEVYTRDAQPQPETYQRGETYQFTGFLVQHEKHRPNQQHGLPILRLYAFQIRHLDAAD